MKLNKFKRVLPMNIQMFTGDGGAGSGEGSGGEGGNGGSGEGDDPQPIIFASQSELDSALDKHTNKALETARQKWMTESEQAVAAAKSEAEEMASLTAEQQAEAKKRKETEAMAAREADITRRELRAQSLEQLAEKALPKELIDIVVLTDAEACLKSIESIEISFRSAVEAGVNERLASSANPPAGGGNSGSGNEKVVGANALRISEREKNTKTKAPKNNPYFKED